MAKPLKAQTDAGGRPLTGRPVIYATEGLISSGHYLTSMAGMQMLLAGGNAFDAVVAAGFAAAVTEPIASYSLGAESVFMLHHAASGDLLSLSGQGTAPARATVAFYREQELDCIPTGPGSLAHLSFTVSRCGRWLPVPAGALRDPEPASSAGAGHPASQGWFSSL